MFSVVSENSGGQEWGRALGPESGGPGGSSDCPPRVQIPSGQTGRAGTQAQLPGLKSSCSTHSYQVG